MTKDQETLIKRLKKLSKGYLDNAVANLGNGFEPMEPKENENSYVNGNRL